MIESIEINNYNFQIQKKGSGDKIIFVHGSSSDHRTWKHQISFFSEQFTCLSYSRRFHWPNKKIEKEEDYSMQQHVEDLARLIEYIGSEEVTLVGHSYGALVCLELAAQQVIQIQKLVLIEPPAIRLFVSNIPKPMELFKLLFSKPKTAISIIKLGAKGIDPATKAARRGDLKKALELFGKAVLGPTAFAKMSDERKKQALDNLTISELTGSGFLPIDQEKLKSIQIPILLLSGKNSPAVFKNLIDALHSILPNTIQEEISKSSHIIQEDNPEEFNEVVLGFLE